MIPLIQHEVVDRHHWLTNQEFVDALALGYSLPGPISTKIAAYVGYKISGFSGAVAGVVGIVLPSAAMILVLGAFMWKFKESTLVQSALKGVRPAIVALLIMVVYDVWPSSVNNLTGGLIMVAAFVGVTFLNVHPAYAIAAAAVVGMLIY